MFKYVSLLKCLSHYVVIDFKSHIISKNTSSLTLILVVLVGSFGTSQPFLWNQTWDVQHGTTFDCVIIEQHRKNVNTIASSVTDSNRSDKHVNTIASSVTDSNRSDKHVNTIASSVTDSNRSDNLWTEPHSYTSLSLYGWYTINSEIFSRVLFSRNFDITLSFVNMAK